MRSARFLAGITVSLWSFGMVFSRLIAARSEYLLLSMVFTFTFITMLAYTLWPRRGSDHSPRLVWRPQYLIIGLFGYFFYRIGLNRSFRVLDSASVTALLNYTWPLFTVVFTRLLYSPPPDDRLTRWIERVGIALGFIAVVLVSTKGHLRNLQAVAAGGILWGLAAGMCYGFYSAYSSIVPEKEHGAFLLYSIGASWILMLALSARELPLLASLSAVEVLIVIVIGCVFDGLGYITWTRANSLAAETGVSVSAIASMTFVLPLTNLFWVSLLLRERSILRPYFFVSLLLVTLSSVLCQSAEAIAGWLGGVQRREARPGVKSNDNVTGQERLSNENVTGACHLLSKVCQGRPTSRRCPRCAPAGCPEDGRDGLAAGRSRHAEAGDRCGHRDPRDRTAQRGRGHPKHIVS